MDMQLIKKSDKPVLRRTDIIDLLKEQDIFADSTDTIDIEEPPIEEEEPIYIEDEEDNYIPVRDNPLVQSVGKSGWQISDIWRDIRVDSFYNGY
ncbi:hypothetical protein WKK05_09765 [Nostoc sp. UHCC 0302]|uniref:hypothetical protein n=1 Tax=Nostoc sp. UHCC 0302 TaxID=3134896 RepID=UPI00311C971C